MAKCLYLCARRVMGKRAYAQMKRAKNKKPTFSKNFIQFSKWFQNLSEKDKAAFRKAKDKRIKNREKEKKQKEIKKRETKKKKLNPLYEKPLLAFGVPE